MVRMALAAAALVVCAWFALATRQAHDLDRATAIAQQPKLTAAQAAHADALLHSARQLNPDRQVDLVRGEVALNVGRRGAAMRILRGVVRSEPDNLEAWLEVARAAPNAASFYDALTHVARLERRF